MHYIHHYFYFSEKKIIYKKNLKKMIFLKNQFMHLICILRTQKSRNEGRLILVFFSKMGITR